MRKLILFFMALLVAAHAHAQAQIVQKVVDIPTRPGITQRLLVLSPPEPKAAVILFPGGHGGLQLSANGAMKWGENNFLVRTRRMFADQGLLVAVIDAPSDRQAPPFLGGFRLTPQHAADTGAVIAWLRDTAKVPVWLAGTSRGTLSVAYLATELTGPAAPDGIVLTATILTDDRMRPVPAMPLDRIRVPVLVAHHEQDGCKYCPFSQTPALMSRLNAAPRRQLISFKGGVDRGDPCQASAYHGFNGLDRDVVRQIAAWILAK
ncbi:alpha/beta hydrolase [Castellaniella sp. WN]